MTSQTNEGFSKTKVEGEESHQIWGKNQFKAYIKNLDGEGPSRLCCSPAKQVTAIS